MSKMVGTIGGGNKKHPGEPSGGMSNAKCNVNIPAGSVPTGEAQSSGETRHKNMSSGKVENLSNFPKKK